MKGSVFDNLPALKNVDLEANLCVNQIFLSEESVRGLSNTVSGACDKKGTQIACEEISSQEKFCKMRNYTIIRDITYTISDPFNEKVETMSFSNNRNIEFLPILLHQTFPNIYIFSASRCAIKEISKGNFENLVQLDSIYLEENEIYAVLKDTFEGLQNLQTLYLSKF